MIAAVALVSTLLGSAPEMPPEVKTIAQHLDTIEENLMKAPNPEAFRGKTERFAQVWLNDATPEGRARLERLKAAKGGLVCFFIRSLAVSIETVSAKMMAAGVWAIGGKAIMDVILEDIDKLAQDHCQGPGGDAAVAEWREIAKAMLGLMGPKGYARTADPAVQFLQHLAHDGKLIGVICNPIGMCLPNSAAQPAIPQETQVLVIAAALVIGLLPCPEAEPVTVPLLMRLAAAGAMP